MLSLYLTFFEMRTEKSAFYICENKGADRLCDNRAAVQRFGYRDCTIYLLSKSEDSCLALFSLAITRFLPDLVGNPEDSFSHDVAHE